MYVPADIWRFAIPADTMHPRGEGQFGELPIPKDNVHKEIAAGEGRRREMKTKSALYDEGTKKATAIQRAKMADRFDIEIDDVEHAAWVIARDMVGAKLRRDLEEKKGIDGTKRIG